MRTPMARTRGLVRLLAPSLAAVSLLLFFGMCVMLFPLKLPRWLSRLFRSGQKHPSKVKMAEAADKAGRAATAAMKAAEDAENKAAEAEGKAKEAELKAGEAETAAS